MLTARGRVWYLTESSLEAYSEMRLTSGDREKQGALQDTGRV